MTQRDDDERAYKGRGRPTMRGYTGEQPRLSRVTPKSVEVFARLLAADDDADAWWAAQGDLQDALHLPPWCFPAVMAPGEVIAYARPDDPWTARARALWLKLDAALRRKARRR